VGSISLSTYRKPTAVYRTWDFSGALLYVGMTHRLKARLREHRAWSRWWPDVADVTLEMCENRWAAEAVEAAAIIAEKPRHNKASYYARRAWIGSPRDFPEQFRCVATPAPVHVAGALRVVPGTICVRQRAGHVTGGTVVALSTAWSAPQAWPLSFKRGLDQLRTGRRHASDDELALLSLGADGVVACREQLFTFFAHPSFVEDIEMTALRCQDEWDVDGPHVSASPSPES
jgi:predicted GIY-YIG superfamily endonuclease